MDKKELYNLLSEKKSLSKEEINSSLKDNNIVDKTELDNFDQEALEGWLESGKDHIDTSRVLKKLGFNGSKLNLVLAGVISVLVLIVLFWPMMNSKTSLPKKQSQEKIKYVEQTDIYIAEKFDTLIEEPTKTTKEIKSLKRTQKANPIVETTIEDKKPIFIIDELPFKPLETKPNRQSIKVESRKKIKEIYFHTFKLVDYRILRSKPTVSTQQMDLTGTAASMEEKETKEDEVKWRTVDVPYIDYINKTMYFMDKGSLKNALARFDVILSSYPDDINALFYAGFALYNLNEFKSAQIRFEEALKNTISNFDEEALWYLTLSYEKNGDTEKAQQLLKTISKSESYYAKQALEKL